MSDLRLVYITTATREDAVALGRALVKARLAACANVLPGMSSLYWWDGAVQEDQECVLIAKTLADNMPALTAKVQELHGYDVPCVLALPIAADEGNPDYLAWLREEAKPV